MRKPYVPKAHKHDPGAPIGMRFGRRLRKLRTQKGWSQTQMAIELGIDRSYLSDVERGCKSISLPMLEHLAMGFKLTVAELLQDV